MSAQRYPTTDTTTRLMSDRFMFTALPVNARNAIRLRHGEAALEAHRGVGGRRMNEIKAGGQNVRGRR